MADDDFPPFTTIFSSIAIVALTVAMEILVNSDLTCGTSPSTSNDVELTATYIDAEAQTSPLVTTQPQPRDSPLLKPTTLSNPPPEPKPSKFCEELPCCCIAHAAPSTRANRLAVAMILYTLLTTAFIIRIHETQQSGNVNWIFTIVVNILPFTSASFAFLRAFVDAMLVRWGTGLRYACSEEEKGGCVWMPFLPVLTPLVGMWWVAKVVVGVIMGRGVSRSVSRMRVEDIGMHGDEGERLIGAGSDGNNDDGLPAYHETFDRNSK